MKTENMARIEGFITDEPVLEKTESKKSKLTFTIEIKHVVKPGVKERVSFVDIEVWGKLAEENSTLQKFNRVRVEGNIVQDLWKERKEVLSRIVIIASAITKL